MIFNVLKKTSIQTDLLYPKLPRLFVLVFSAALLIMMSTLFSYAETPEKSEMILETGYSAVVDEFNETVAVSGDETVKTDGVKDSESAGFAEDMEAKGDADQVAEQQQDSLDIVFTDNLTDEDGLDETEESDAIEDVFESAEDSDNEEPDKTVSVADPQWYLNAINAKEAWEISSGNGSIVAVIDTGVLSTHEDLTDGIAEVTSTYVRNGSLIGGTDKSGHGTSVAGIIIAADNEKGITGVAPGARIISIKTGGDSYRDSNISLAAVVEAIDYAVKAGADVINLSIGLKMNLAEKYPQLTEPLYTAIKKATDAGLPVVCAAGNAVNGDTGNMFFPATMEETIAVGAVQLNDDGTMELWDKSCMGSAIDLVAPGKEILTTGAYGFRRYCIPDQPGQTV